MINIPLVCHPSHKSILESDLKLLKKKHPLFNGVINLALPENLDTYHEDVYLIEQQWSFNRMSLYAQAYPPPDTRRIVLFNKYFCEGTWIKRRSILLHEIGHYDVYDNINLSYLRRFIESLENFDRSNQVHRILRNHPRGVPAIKRLIKVIKLPDELGADYFVSRLEPRLFAWRLFERIEQNRVSLQEASVLLSNEQTVMIEGSFCINRLVRLKSTYKLCQMTCLLNPMNEICTIFESILKESPTLKMVSLNFPRLFNYIEEFVSITTDCNRANNELVDHFKNYIQEFGASLYEIEVSLTSLNCL